MTKTFDLNNMGLAPLSNVEMDGTDGGGWLNWAKFIGQQIISNWDDIKQGTIAGWNSVHYD